MAAMKIRRDTIAKDAVDERYPRAVRYKHLLLLVLEPHA
jgi:hypothetical protein